MKFEVLYPLNYVSTHYFIKFQVILFSSLSLRTVKVGKLVQWMCVKVGKHDIFSAIDILHTSLDTGNQPHNGGIIGLFMTIGNKVIVNNESCN